MIVNGQEIEITRKQVKNINLRVYPDGKIKVSIPLNTRNSAVKSYIESKEEWINAQLQRFEEQARMMKRDYVSGEDAYLNGKRYILKVYEDTNSGFATIENSKTIGLHLKKNASYETRKRIMNSFYREKLEQKLNDLVPKWEEKIGVSSNNYCIRKMKNRWGSCNTKKKEINFNIELAKKKDVEVQYVVIHELLHLIEEKHNDNFTNLLYKYCPKWEEYHDTLNEVINSVKYDF